MRIARRVVPLVLAVTMPLAGGVLVGFGSAAAAKPPHGFSIVEGHVYYLYAPWTPKCPKTASRRPLAGVLVEVKRKNGTGKASTRTDRFGHYLLSLRGSGPISGHVALSGPRLDITPITHKGDGPYIFGLSNLHTGSGNALVIRGVDQNGSPGPAGAANLWMVLSQGADAGARLADPVKVPKVFVRWPYTYQFKLNYGTEKPGTLGYVGDSKEIIVGIRSAAWEPWQLLHEYGHHLLHSLAPVEPLTPVGQDTTNHDRTASYPNQPWLAWTEGFAHAFAAAVINKGGTLSLNCGNTDQVNLATSPVSPRYTDPNKAQYNELAAAAALWQSATNLGEGAKIADGGGGSLVGGGNAVDGLGWILRAAKYYNYRGHHPERMREARDAITEALLRSTLDNEALDQRISLIFRRQDMGWGFAVNAYVTDAHSDLDNHIQPPALVLSLTAPGAYNGCDNAGYAQDGTPKQGGIPDKISIVDNCQPVPIDAIGQNQGGVIGIGYPYLEDQAHRNGDYTVYATYMCANLGSGLACPASRSVTFNVTRGTGKPIYYPDVVVNAPMNQAVPLIRVTSVGACTILPTNTDCSR